MEKILINMCRLFKFEKIIDNYTALVKMDKAMSAQKDGNTINFMSEYRWRTEFPIDYYGDGKMTPFGNLNVRIPSKAEEILCSLYGDYMALPPEDKRYKHCLTLIKEKE